MLLDHRHLRSPDTVPTTLPTESLPGGLYERSKPTAGLHRRSPNGEATARLADDIAAFGRAGRRWSSSA